MEVLFSRDYWLLWMVALALALYLPIRQMIWVIYVRRAQRTGEVDRAEQARLRQRAGFTAALICLVFAFLYTGYLFRDSP